MKMKHRRSRAEVIARVLARQGIDRIGPQLARFGRTLNGRPDLFFQRDLIEADRLGLDDFCLALFNLNEFVYVD